MPVSAVRQLESAALWQPEPATVQAHETGTIHQPASGPVHQHGTCAVLFVSLSLLPFSRRSAAAQMTSSSSRPGSAGKCAAGSVWYQYATEAISSCKGRYRPPLRHPSA